MKLIFFISLSLPLQTFALGHDCSEVTYSAEDFALVADHENDMNKTCLAASKAALWKACVDCAGEIGSGDNCHAGALVTTADENAKVCHGRAEAKAKSCTTSNLVHCADLAP